MKEFSAKLLRSEVVHTGRVFTTVRDQIALPNGKQATLDIERHPAGNSPTYARQRSFSVSAAVSLRH